MIAVDQMYVHYRIPEGDPSTPIVMVHGSNGSGTIWETTPDGREGWATWFVRQGHPVFVVDHAGRGRSGFDPSRVNAAIASGSAAELPNLFLATYQREWVNGRMGATYPTPFPGVRFPIAAFDRFMELHVPNAETTLADDGGTTVSCLAALLDEIGPAVVMVHSQGGLYGIDLVRRRYGSVAALVSIEGGCETVTPELAADAFANVPFVSVWGDNSEGAALVNGDERREGCRRAVDLIVAAGGRAELMLLPEQGVAGNSHYLMMDDNNLAVAEMLLRWIDASLPPTDT